MPSSHPVKTRSSARRLSFESLEIRRLLAFGVTNGTTPTGQTTYVIDNGADLKFAVLKGGSLSSTIHLGDLTSVQYKGRELLAPYSSTSRYSHYEQGLGSTTTITYTIGAGNSWILVTCDDSVNGVIQYYGIRPNDNNVYMASYVTAGGEGRFLAYLSRNVFTNIEEPSNIDGNIGAVEGSDVFYLADGTTRSKFYNDRRIIENEYHGVTGVSGTVTVGAWMYMGNREHSAGGPFFKTIDYQTTSGAVEIYNVLFSGHAQTETYRFGLQGPYTLQITNGSAPTTPDYSWMENVGISGWVPQLDRGSVSGTASGMTPGNQTVVGLSNSQAQYWAIANPTTGAFTISGVQSGTYTMTMYDRELAVSTRTITVNGGANTPVNITNTFYEPTATWQIGNWDGTPAGFMNADKIAIMHPSDVRMSPWVSSNFVVGTDTIDEWPMAQFIGVNNGQRITFTLTAAQAATAQTLRIGITIGFAGGRNRITVNAGLPNTWTSSIPAASINLNSRGVTRGTYRGPNQLYTYNIPTSALVVGVNTIDLPVVSGSSGVGFLSPNLVYDAIDLVPTSLITNAPRVQSIVLSPATTTLGFGQQTTLTAAAFDQFGNPIPANIEFTSSGGTIDQTGRFTAQSVPTVNTITATSGTVSTTATVVVAGPIPLVVQPATASPPSTSGQPISLSVLGGDDGGEAALIYTWTVLGTPPGSVSFSANGSNAAKNTTVTLSENGNYDLLVIISDANGNTATSQVTVSRRTFVARYLADETSGTTLSDSSGGNNTGTLTGVVGFNAGRFGNSVNFNGGSATLPSGLMNGITNFTISTWVNLTTADSWARIFDFGTGTASSMFLTPRNGATNFLRFAITTSGNTNEQQINTTRTIPTGTWTHIAVTLNGTVGILYVDGIEVGRNNNMTLNPSSLGTTTLNYLGKSQYADPNLRGSLDDFRIYASALLPAQVAAIARDNQPPVATASQVSLVENQSKSFSISDFLYNDTQNDPLVSIEVSQISLAAGDTLTVNLGAGPIAVSNGMIITASQLTTLTYTPAADSTGANRASFDFIVSDVDPGTVSATMSITVLPDSQKPSTQVLSAAANAQGLFTVNVSGTAGTAAKIAKFHLYVSIDGGVPSLAGTISAGAIANNSTAGSGPYQGLADGVQHSYRFFTRGEDMLGNLEGSPSDGDVTTVQTFALAPLTATAIDIQNGTKQRSYIRNVDLLFNSSSSLTQILNPGRIAVEKFEFSATNVTAGTGAAVAFQASQVGVENRLRIDFGSNGLGGSRNTTAGNGFYRVRVDSNGDGDFNDANESFEFFRLLGDVNGDGAANVIDRATFSQYFPGTAADLDADLNGDGAVNVLDRSIISLALTQGQVPVFMRDLRDD